MQAVRRFDFEARILAFAKNCLKALEAYLQLFLQLSEKELSHELSARPATSNSQA
jgi:hypothetical protein